MCETVHVVSLALWLAATFGSALAAAIAFPTMKALRPTLAGYASPEEHYLIAAGSVAQRVFFAADVVHFSAALVALASLGASVLIFGTPARRTATVIRTLSLSVAVAALASLLLIVTPKVVSSAGAHWAALKSGDVAAAAMHKASMDEVHPIASRLMGVMGVSVLISLSAAAWSLARKDDAGERPRSGPGAGA